MESKSEDRMVGKAQEVIVWLHAFIAAWKERRGNADWDEPLFEIKLRRRKRTLTQNAYYWVMLGQLASALGMRNDDVHGMMLRSYGVYDVFTVREDVPIEAYFRYYDVVGEGKLNGRTYRHVRAFKGSSEMDSKEFSKLIEGMRQECEQQGIETKTPSEIARLQWIEGVA